MPCNEKLRTHRRHTDEETYSSSLFTFVAQYIFNHCLREKHNKNAKKFQILLNKKKSECLNRNFLMYVFRILFNNDPQQISFHSAKKWLRKWYRKKTFSSKMHNGENAFEVLLYLYKQCKHHTKICVFCIEMDSFWKHVIIYVWIV